MSARFYLIISWVAYDARGLRGFAWDEKSHPTHLNTCLVVRYTPCVACVG
ncbi:MAG: hypothetical protein M0P00_06580 [Bacteroidaceae bacterium]|nr:hypothetical protein [Bacteroidaceae bacterium]